MSNDDRASTAGESSLPLRLRPDFVVTRLILAGEDYRVLHDPATGKHFQLREEEYFLLAEMSRGVHARELCNRFQARFPGRTLSLAQLELFLFQAYRAGIVISDYAQQGKSQWEQRRSYLKRRWWEGMLSVLQWRMVRFNPQHILQVIGPVLRHLYSGVALFIWCAGLIATLWIILAHRHEIIADFPFLSHGLRSANPLLFMAALLVAKSWHELGHAVACYRFGVRCREMGVQLLFGVPCLYCDATESWQLENKWKRMAISAGGIYFEGFLAACCALLFHCTLPGAIHQLSLYLVFVCTIGTLLINANPRLRLDGYYLLSDSLEVANLETRAFAHLSTLSKGMFAGSGLRVVSPFETDLDWRLVLFGMAMVCYRIVLLLGMVWMLRQVLIPGGLSPVADLATAVILLSAIIPWCLSYWRSCEHDFAVERRNSWRVRVLIGVAIALAMCFSVPLPTSISVPAVLETAEQRSVYATVSGRLAEIVPEGTGVSRNTLLASLENQELARERKILHALIVEQESLVKQLETGIVLAGAETGFQLQTARQSLTTLRARWQQLERLWAGLQIFAPCDGIVHSAPKKKETTSSRELDMWSGKLTDPINRGAYVETGTLLCKLAEGDAMSALALVDQSEAERIHQDDHVLLRLKAIAPAIRGRVLEVARTEAETIPLTLRESGLPTRSYSTAYFVKIRLDETPLAALSGMKLQAAIHVQGETLFAKLARAWSGYWRVWPDRTYSADTP